jgi:hypothetical protein
MNSMQKVVMRETILISVKMVYTIFLIHSHSSTISTLYKTRDDMIFIEVLYNPCWYIFPSTIPILKITIKRCGRGFRFEALLNRIKDKYNAWQLWNRIKNEDYNIIVYYNYIKTSIASITWSQFRIM